MGVNLVPQASKIIMKLEVFGLNTCSRWHQDQYASRALVCYNGKGTEFTSDSNINWDEYKDCGNNDHVIRDRNQIRWAKAGDIFLIKGLNFPGVTKGLVHKSPCVEYYPDGSVRKRLLLKIDIETVDGDGLFAYYDIARAKTPLGL